MPHTLSMAVRKDGKLYVESGDRTEDKVSQWHRTEVQSCSVDPQKNCPDYRISSTTYIDVDCCCSAFMYIHVHISMVGPIITSKVVV